VVVSDGNKVSPSPRDQVAAALSIDPDRAQKLLEFYNQVDLWGHDHVNRVLRILYSRTIPEILGRSEEIE
jgi:hypothetical protein